MGKKQAKVEDIAEKVDLKDELEGESVWVRKAKYMRWPEYELLSELAQSSEKEVMPDPKKITELIARNVVAWTFKDPDTGDAVAPPKFNRSTQAVEGI